MSTFRCRSCGALNRIRPEAARSAGPGARPVCGRCRAEIDVSGDPQPVTGQALWEAVGSAPVPVLLDVWAPWCGPCRTAAPIFEALGRRHAGELLVLKLDSDAEPDAASRLGIQAIPTFVLFRSGREVARQSGVMPLDQLDRWVEVQGAIPRGGHPVA